MARHESNEHADDLHAELGYRSSGRREVRVREWFSLRGEPTEAAPTPRAFKQLVAQLRNGRHNPPRHAAMKLARALERRGHVFTCSVCGAEWCAIGKHPNGTVPKVCSRDCWKIRRRGIKQRSIARRRRGERAERPRAKPRVTTGRLAHERALYARRPGATKHHAVYRCAFCAVEWCQVRYPRNPKRRMFCAPICRYRFRCAAALAVC